MLESRLFPPVKGCSHFPGRETAERHNDLNKCAGIRIAQSYLSTKFFDSLSHTSDADANAVRPELSNLTSNSLAIVTHSNG